MMTRFLALLSLVPLAAACGDASAQDPVVLDSGCAETETFTDGSVSAWESAGWPPDIRCDWLPFDARTTVEIPHDLGRAPRSVEIYISFEADGSMSTPASGDAARIVAVDDVSAQLRNATNQDFFLKVVLR